MAEVGVEILMLCKHNLHCEPGKTDAPKHAGRTEPNAGVDGSRSKREAASLSDSKLEIRQSGPDVAAAGQMGKATRDARGVFCSYTAVCAYTKVSR